MLATGAGVLAAVTVSGAAEERAPGSITIRGEQAASLTIQGSNFADVATISQAQGAGLITIAGENVSSQRKGCDPVVKGTTYTCEAQDVKQIEASLRKGGDELSFEGRGLAALTIIGVTGDGNDRLYGAPGPETLKGGENRDRLEGGNGNDKLRGGPARDQLDGGKGEDDCDDDPDDKSVLRCETTHLR